MNDRRVSTGVCVIGSVNLDTVISVEKIPRSGETVAALEVATFPGGKGLNQAIACSRAGAPTSLIACVGQDDRSAIALDLLRQSDVDLSALRCNPGASGAATVMVDQLGSNAIVVSAGANGELRELSAQDRHMLGANGVILAQLEIPISAVIEAASACLAAGGTFILNPSPARHLPRELIASVDILVVNERESEELDADQLGIGVVITTLGERGVTIRGADRQTTLIPGRLTTPVDTTGAGDAFAGVLAAELSRGLSIEEAARRSNIAGSLAVEHRGAGTAMPSRSQIDAALAGTTPRPAG